MLNYNKNNYIPCAKLHLSWRIFKDLTDYKKFKQMYFKNSKNKLECCPFFLLREMFLFLLVHGILNEHLIDYTKLKQMYFKNSKDK